MAPGWRRATHTFVSCCCSSVRHGGGRTHEESLQGSAPSPVCLLQVVLSSDCLSTCVSVGGGLSLSVRLPNSLALAHATLVDCRSKLDVSSPGQTVQSEVLRDDTSPLRSVLAPGGRGLGSASCQGPSASDYFIVINSSSFISLSISPD